MLTPILSDSLQTGFHIARALAREYYNEFFSAPHLLRALLHTDVGGSEFLSSIGKEVAYFKEWADVRIEACERVGYVPQSPTGDKTIVAILEEADHVRIQLGLDTINPICVLAALAKPGIGFSIDQLRSLPLQERDVLNPFLHDKPVSEFSTSTVPSHADATKGALLKYCIDKTAQARRNELDPIIGREKEIRQMLEILGRRSKPNVILAGDPGVGKTALVEGLAQQIIDGTVPGWLKNATLFELELGSLVAGASYKGEVEDRLKTILSEIKQIDTCILFIDELHALLDSKGSVGSGAANLLKPELARGELTVIGATTLDEYRKIIEPDQAFSRRFELLKVEEPLPFIAERMVRQVVPLYEHHHQISLDPQAIPECVRLAKRYMKDRRLPDSALDLLDRTMAAIRIANETSGTELSELKQKINELEAIPVENKLSECRWINTLIDNQISPVLLGQRTDETDPETIESVEQYKQYLDQKIDDLQHYANQQSTIVTKAEMAAVVSHKTGIPIGKVQAGEKERLLNMETYLRNRVVGQDHALKALADAILESRSGLQKAGQPIGSFFLLGPTGTGKTEVCKALADFLFNDERAIIRFDMSEFKEEHSAALLYGAPPGYVGYEEGGLLVNKIRQQPYAVVLFDEIEKAHPSVFDIFLQIMDEGRLHDKLGKEGDFSNALIIFTSNISSDWISAQFGQGLMPTATQLLDQMRGHFRPEFLGRLTEIVPFGPISTEVVVRIFSIQLRQLEESLHRQGIRLDVTDEARRHLALQDFTPHYGARPLVGIIRNRLRRPISRMIISGQVSKGFTVYVDWQSEDLIFKVEEPGSQPVLLGG